MARPLYYLPNARNDEQLQRMRDLQTDEACLFCEGQDPADPAPLHRTEHWSVRRNTYSYAGAGLHLLLVPREHSEDLLDLTPPAREDFWNALAWVKREHGLTHYGLAARNGDCAYTGGTIAHVHVHVLVGGDDGPPVRVRLSSRPESP